MYKPHLRTLGYVAVSLLLLSVAAWFFSRTEITNLLPYAQLFLSQFFSVMVLVLTLPFVVIAFLVRLFALLIFFIALSLVIIFVYSLSKEIIFTHFNKKKEDEHVNSNTDSINN